jgi:hypothetical protein
VALAASGAAGEDTVAPNAQERFKFAVDPDVDILPGSWANEMQPFHRGLRIFNTAPMGADCTFYSVFRRRGIGIGWRPFTGR